MQLNKKRIQCCSRHYLDTSRTGELCHSTLNIENFSFHIFLNVMGRWHRISFFISVVKAERTECFWQDANKDATQFHWFLQKDTSVPQTGYTWLLIILMYNTNTNKQTCIIWMQGGREKCCINLSTCVFLYFRFE